MLYLQVLGSLFQYPFLFRVSIVRRSRPITRRLSGNRIVTSGGGKRLIFFFWLLGRLRSLFLRDRVRNTNYFVASRRSKFRDRNSNGDHSLTLPSTSLVKVPVYVFQDRSTNGRGLFRAIPNFLLACPRVPRAFPSSIPGDTSKIGKFYQYLGGRLRFPMSFPRVFSPYVYSVPFRRGGFSNNKFYRVYSRLHRDTFS